VFSNVPAHPITTPTMPCSSWSTPSKNSCNILFVSLNENIFHTSELNWAWYCEALHNECRGALSELRWWLRGEKAGHGSSETLIAWNRSFESLTCPVHSERQGDKLRLHKARAVPIHEGLVEGLFRWVLLYSLLSFPSHDTWNPSRKFPHQRYWVIRQAKSFCPWRHHSTCPLTRCDGSVHSLDPSTSSLCLPFKGLAALRAI